MDVDSKYSSSTSLEIKKRGERTIKEELYASIAQWLSTDP